MLILEVISVSNVPLEPRQGSRHFCSNVTWRMRINQSENVNFDRPGSVRHQNKTRVQEEKKRKERKYSKTSV